MTKLRDELARVIQLEDAECFPTLNLKQTDYCARLAQAIIDHMKPMMDEVVGAFEELLASQHHGYDPIIVDALTKLSAWREGV